MTVSYNLLILNLLKYGWNKWTVTWAENCQICWAQGFLSATWHPAGGQALTVYTKGCCCVLYCWISLFLILVMGHWAALSKFAADKKLRGVADTPDYYAAVKKHVIRLKKRKGNLVKFNEGKMPSFALCHLYAGAGWLERSFAEKDLKFLVDGSSVFSWQKRPSNFLGCRGKWLFNFMWYWWSHVWATVHSSAVFHNSQLWFDLSVDISIVSKKPISGVQYQFNCYFILNKEQGFKQGMEVVQDHGRILGVDLMCFHWCLLLTQ